MDRVIAYVDGYNLYHGLRTQGWKRFYWLNISANSPKASSRILSSSPMA